MLRQSPRYLYPVYANISKKGSDTDMIFKPNLMRRLSMIWRVRHLHTVRMRMSGEKEEVVMPLEKPVRRT